SDNVCQSNLQMKYRYGYMTADGDTFTPLDLQDNVPVIELSNQKDIALEVKVTNMNGDDAHEASLVASFPRSLTYSAYHVPPEKQVTCVANRNGSQVDCELGNPFKRDSETTFYIILSTSGISTDTKEVEIDLQLETTSSQGKIAPVKAKAKVNIVLQLSVSGVAQPSQVYFSGQARAETAMKTENDIGSAITHQFRIINLGKGLKDYGTATLNINWPKKTDKGGWLLYLMKISATGVEQLECSPNAEVNPLQTETSNKRTRRAAGNTQGTNEGTISRLLDNKNFETLSCGKGAKCVMISCPLRGMGSNAIITVKSRLWNSTFLKDYSKLHRVEVIVPASLHIDSTTKNTVVHAETQVRLTVFPERRADKYGGGVPWWIIVLTILLLLMLLALLAFLLWKCGLFGKKNKQHLSE
ncbi:integrin alpha-6-like, partial [Plectropomus leopardus]|uniref:integrin alpha-6-like n=1 Tax=Plectropomus leopardus TaxID=160734 RepID=UPI001C4AA5A9